MPVLCSYFNFIQDCNSSHGNETLVLPQYTPWHLSTPSVMVMDVMASPPSLLHHHSLSKRPNLLAEIMFGQSVPYRRLSAEKLICQGVVQVWEFVSHLGGMYSFFKYE